MYQNSETDSWIQIATVHGAVRDCGDSDFPGIYIRLDDPTVFNFIFPTIFPKGTFIFFMNTRYKTLMSKQKLLVTKIERGR